MPIHTGKNTSPGDADAKAQAASQFQSLKDATDAGFHILHWDSK